MFGPVFKSIDEALRQEAGCTTELDYTEQSSWVLFLKYLDDLERHRANEAVLNGETYNPIISARHSWSSWAAPSRFTATRCARESTMVS